MIEESNGNIVTLGIYCGVSGELRFASISTRLSSEVNVNPKNKYFDTWDWWEVQKRKAKLQLGDIMAVSWKRENQGERKKLFL